jgi:hypothetical protein
MFVNIFRPKGWRNESYRHYLAAKGVKTRMYSQYLASKKRFFMHKDSPDEEAAERMIDPDEGSPGHEARERPSEEVTEKAFAKGFVLLPRSFAAADNVPILKVKEAGERLLPQSYAAGSRMERFMARKERALR